MATVPNIMVSGADDPDTFSFRDTTPQPAGTVPGAPASPDQLFNAEWDAAQQRYRAGVNAGYSEADADKLYLEPVRNKWDILKDVPPAMKRQANVDLDKAQQSFVAGVQAGYKPEDAENIYLKPAEQKWVASAGVVIPDKDATSDARLKYSAIDLARQGHNADGDVAKQIPTRFWNDPKFVASFEAANVAARKDAARAERLDTAAPEKQAILMNHIDALQKVKENIANGQLKTSPVVSNLVNQVQGQLINKFKQPVQFNPPETAPASPVLRGTPVTLDSAGELPSTKTGAAPKYATKYRTVQEVQEAYRSKELNRDEAKKILQDQFGLD